MKSQSHSGSAVRLSEYFPVEKERMFMPNLQLTCWLVLLSVAFCTAPTLAGSFYGKMTYDGSLGRRTTMTMPSNTEMRFTIHDAQSGGRVVWAESQRVKVGAKGEFRVILGARIPFPDSLGTFPSLWLETRSEFASRPEPRVGLQITPYGLKPKNTGVLGSVGGPSGESPYVIVGGTSRVRDPGGNATGTDPADQLPVVAGALQKEPELGLEQRYMWPENAKFDSLTEELNLLKLEVASLKERLMKLETPTRSSRF